MNTQKRLWIIAIILASALSGCTQNSAVKEPVNENGVKWLSTVRARVAEMQKAAKKEFGSEKASVELGKRQKSEVAETKKGEEEASLTKASSQNSTASEIAEERNADELVQLPVSESEVETEYPQPTPQPQPNPPALESEPEPVPEPEPEPEPPAQTYYYAEYIPEWDEYFFTYEEEAIAWAENIRSTKQIETEPGVWEWDPNNLMVKNGYIGWSGGSGVEYKGVIGFSLGFY
ncbi:MAG: hypothetical protein SOR89_00895 [Ndongobacter sp.]|nr:hypothetical protein [Ndongobacter sp.]